MRKRFLPLLCVVIFLLTGCHRFAPPSQQTAPTDPESGLILGEPRPEPVPRADNTFSMGQAVEIAGSSRESRVSYTVNDVAFYSSFAEAGIDIADKKHVELSGGELFGHVDENGKLEKGITLVMLDVTATAVEAPDGHGMDSANEHSLDMQITVGGVTMGAPPFYFAFEETDTIHRANDDINFYSYWLPKGETVHMRVGLAVKKEKYPDKSVHLKYTAEDGDYLFVLLHEGEEM